MKTFNFRSFFKFLSRNKAYTAIDIFGLSVSLMLVLLIAVYVERELSIDQKQENKDRKYTANTGYVDSTFFDIFSFEFLQPMAERLRRQNHLPLVDSGTRLHRHFRHHSRHSGMAELQRRQRESYK